MQDCSIFRASYVCGVWSLRIFCVMDVVCGLEF